MADDVEAGVHQSLIGREVLRDAVRHRDDADIGVHFAEIGRLAVLNDNAQVSIKSGQPPDILADLRASTIECRDDLPTFLHGKSNDVPTILTYAIDRNTGCVVMFGHINSPLIDVANRLK